MFGSLCKRAVNLFPAGAVEVFFQTDLLPRSLRIPQIQILQVPTVWQAVWSCAPAFHTPSLSHLDLDRKIRTLLPEKFTMLRTCWESKDYFILTGLSVVFSWQSYSSRRMWRRKWTLKRNGAEGEVVTHHSCMTQENFQHQKENLSQKFCSLDSFLVPAGINYQLLSKAKTSLLNFSLRQVDVYSRFLTSLTVRKFHHVCHHKWQGCVDQIGKLFSTHKSTPVSRALKYKNSPPPCPNHAIMTSWRSRGHECSTPIGRDKRANSSFLFSQKENKSKEFPFNLVHVSFSIS